MIELVRGIELSTQQTNFYRSLNLFKAEWLLHKQIKDIEKLKDSHGFYKKLLSSNKKEILGYCLCYPMSWESAHYGMKIGKLDFSFIKQISEKESRQAFDSLITEAKNRSFNYLYINIVDGSYIENLLLDIGFELIEKTIHYLTDINGFRKYYVNNEDAKLNQKVRCFESTDWNQVKSIIDSTHFLSRYTKDSFFEPKKVVEMYFTWMKNLTNKKKYNRLYVSTIDEKIIACGGVSIVKDLADSNYLLLGNSILASSLNGVGAGSSIVKKTLEFSFKNKLNCLFSTSHSNLAMQSILEKLGCQVGSVVKYYRIII